MFQLDKHDASIANVNQRIQRHGEERQLAADIKFTLSAANEVLDAFDPTLRQDLFRKPARGEQQDLPKIGGDGLTAVKHPGLEPLKLSHEFAGCELHIAGLLEAGEPIVLMDAKLKRFVIEPMEGGSLSMSFTASAEVEPQELAELSEALIRQDVLLTVIPPQRTAPAEDLTQGGDTLDAQAAQDAAAAEAASLIEAGKAATTKAAA